MPKMFSDLRPEEAAALGAAAFFCSYFFSILFMTIAIIS